MNPKQRDRGRILTPDGLSRLQQAIRAWELEHELRCTQERIKELTGAVKEGGLDPGTIRKILKAKEGVDPESIRCLFTTFGLQLAEVDLVSSLRLQIQADPNFVGREGAIADLNALVNRGAKVIVIQARGGVGKTTLARKYLQQEFGSFLEFPIAKETKDIASIESLIEEKLRQLGEEPGREFFVSLDRLKRKLQAEHIGILLDNLEPALDAAGKLIEPHRRYVELLRVLADPSVQAVTLITNRERLNEYSISVQHYLLEELSLEAWNQFFQHRFALFAGDRDVSDADETALANLHKAYGGNAKAMDILCGAVLTDYSSNINAYWQANQDDLLIERALEDLVVGQFDRLQQLDPDAYNLLCRIGCYRYQDVPTVPIEGLLCLLWDIPENRQRRVVKSLQERSLVEFENGEYWLHPVIRGEAIGRLRQGEDWKVTNQKTAEFWTKSAETVQTVEDALRVLEAYYHYLEIRSFEEASDAILERRGFEWIDIDEDLMGYTLGASLIRLGLLQQIDLIISQIIDKITNNLSLSMLYSMLGETSWLTGNIKKGIEYHEKSKNIAMKSGNKRLEIISRLHLGLCRTTLWEIEEARNLFIEVSSIAENTKYHRYAVQSWYCLAYLNSCLLLREEAFLYCDKVRDSLPKVKLGVRTTGYRFSYLGIALGKLEKNQESFEMHQQAILYAEKSNFSQLKAISSLGLSELYRNQNDFRLALELNLKSVEVLERIDDKCDLADAYYQLGLTYQAMDAAEKSNESFQEAIRLFSEMEAPKQVERVRRSMLTDTSK